VDPKGLRARFMGRPAIDPAKCQRCGTCERKCPYNACSLTVDIEDGFPVIDTEKCRGCFRCLNKCPFRAIEWPGQHTELRARYPKVNLVPPGEKCEDGSIAVETPLGWQLNKRMLIGKETQLLVLVLIAVVAIAIPIFISH
jgi:Fe-S-cluster-containing hydrogenase component 2